MVVSYGFPTLSITKNIKVPHSAQCTVQYCLLSNTIKPIMLGVLVSCNVHKSVMKSAQGPILEKYFGNVCLQQ